ncbi:Endoglucanase A [Chionoecetes opilio]|uniref:Endoglucanase n=1 Tax=Chionoecetes opilio TaxID=41210 RepID=A0A8J4XRR5_CHIOP|nr:Endoglucanase A [Chionoecetes opilio]
MSYVFYEAQRSGKLPASQRVTWRGDSALDDGSDVFRNLSGGYYDAGDHVKFGFPMAFTATMLGWGLLDFTEGHETAGQDQYALEAIKWATDYFIKAFTQIYEFYGQTAQDRARLSRTSVPTVTDRYRSLHDRMIEFDRGTQIGCENGADRGTQIGCENGAFKLDSRELLDAYPRSSWSGYGDELCWAALWLARATGDHQYIEKAKAHWEEFDLTKDQVQQFSWDDKRAGVYALFYLLTEETEFLDLLNTYLDWLKNTATYTPEGLVHLDTWGANRHAANVAFISLWAAKNGIDQENNRQWARGQIGQLLGDNSRYERSFVVGYGQDPPQRPHHRSSSCPFPPSDCHFGLQQSGPNPHTLYGALVGGPSQSGEYEDDREDYVRNEVACDYNAAFTGALAALVEIS